MLDRYIRTDTDPVRDPVVIINTDYFAEQTGNHGAQGLAVKRGQRLDGQAHSDNDRVHAFIEVVASERCEQAAADRVAHGIGSNDA